MSGLALRNVSKRFGDTPVLDDVSLEIGADELLVVLGPSGCGKSTLLRVIAGLETIDSGEILIDGGRVDRLPPGKRGVAMVFQSYALYPHMSVRENMAFGLVNIGTARDGDRPAHRGGGADAGDGASARPQAGRAFGRPASARRHRPRHRQGAEGLHVRRAAVEPGRGAAQPHAAGDRRPAPAHQDRDDLRHPRPDRGDDASPTASW